MAAPSESTAQVIKLAGYEDYFAIYPSVEVALAAVQTRQALGLPGQIIENRYQIESTLGQGRLGVVLKAWDTHTKQAVVLKIFLSNFSEQTIKHFTRQAPQVLALDHPHIIKVLSIHQNKDFAFIVEEYIPAQTLQQRLAHKKPILEEEAMAIALDITRALEYAHSRGILHGNLKPINILLSSEGTKLLGFGLGRLEEGKNLLNTPFAFQTAAYLAPEQILGNHFDARTDLYTLGVLLYQLFTGHLPFNGF